MARFLVMGTEGIIQVLQFSSLDSEGTVETDERFSRGFMYVTTSDDHVPDIEFSDEIVTSECEGKRNVLAFSDFDSNGGGDGMNLETDGLSADEEQALEEEGIDWLYENMDQDGEYFLFPGGMELYDESEKFLGTYWRGQFHAGKTESELFSNSHSS